MRILSKISIEMVVRKDIVAISIPFSAGVITAALLPPGGDVPIWTAAGCSLAVAALFVLACRRGGRTVELLLLFWLLGLLCGLSAALVPTVPRSPDPGAADALQAAIDAAGFPHTESAALLKALLLGRRDALSRATEEAFRAAGASHILALSGLHLGILYGILQVLLACLGRSRGATILRSALSLAAAGAYLRMTGGSPSLVRAFLFICLSEAARLLPGRRRAPLNIFCAALTIQLAADPACASQLGFQLSYLAMLGITLVFPRLDAWYPPSSRHDPVRRIWSAAALTLSCQLFTAPLVWIRFHSFPKFFLLTNLGALPLCEAFIWTSLPVLALGGSCPEGIKKLADAVGQTLLHFLEGIAAIS